MGAGIGWIIDRMAGTSPWGLIVFLLLGFGAGVLNVMAARFSRARGSRTPFLARVFSGNRALADALVISKRQAASLSKSAGSAEALARGLATKKLEAEIWVAPPKQQHRAPK